MRVFLPRLRLPLYLGCAGIAATWQCFSSSLLLFTAITSSMRMCFRDIKVLPRLCSYLSLHLGCASIAATWQCFTLALLLFSLYLECAGVAARFERFASSSLPAISWRRRHCSEWTVLFLVITFVYPYVLDAHAQALPRYQSAFPRHCSFVIALFGHISFVAFLPCNCNHYFLDAKLRRLRVLNKVVFVYIWDAQPLPRHSSFFIGLRMHSYSIISFR